MIMKHFFSRLFIFISVLTGVFAFDACDKLDDNGPFYAYWLLTDAEGPDGPLSQRPELGVPGVNNDNIEVNFAKNITWAVRNELIMLRDYQKSDYYFFTFTRDAHSLQLNSAFHNDGSNDKKIEFSEVPAEFFIPADGHFDVVTLDAKSMVLRAGEITLTFKRN